MAARPETALGLIEVFDHLDFALLIILQAGLVRSYSLPDPAGHFLTEYLGDLFEMFFSVHGRYDGTQPENLRARRIEA